MDYSQLTNSAPAVLVEFYASWCPHCQHMMPVVAKVKEAVAGEADVYQIDVDANPELTEREKVESYPTFIIYRDGRERERIVGETTAENLIDRLRSSALAAGAQSHKV